MEIGNKSQAISILIEVLRSLPPEDTTVSKDCMVTTIQRVPPHAHVRYELLPMVTQVLVEALLQLVRREEVERQLDALDVRRMRLVG